MAVVMIPLGPFGTIRSIKLNHPESKIFSVEC